MANQNIDFKNMLFREIDNQLINYFIKLGFKKHPLMPEEQLDTSDFNKIFPFGRLKRRKGTNLEIIEIQYDTKHGRLRFIINFGVIPKDGVTIPWEKDLNKSHISQEKCGLNCAKTLGRLSSSRIFSKSAMFEKWFLLRKSDEIDESKIIKLVSKATELSSQVEDWFTKGDIGTHMRIMEF